MPSGGGEANTSSRLPAGSRMKRRGDPHRSSLTCTCPPCSTTRASVSSKSSTCEREVGARGRRALPFEQVDVVAVRQLEPGDAREVLDLPQPEDVAVEGGAALEILRGNLHRRVMQPNGRHQLATSSACVLSQRASSSVK